MGVKIAGGIGAEHAAAIDWEADDFEVDEADAPTIADAMVTCIDMSKAMAGAFSGDGQLSSDEASCIGDEFADDDMKAVLEYTLVNRDAEVPIELAEPLADAIVQCLDIGALLVEEFTGGADGISEESAQCLADAIPRDSLREVVVAGMAGEEDPAALNDFTRAVLGAAADCLTDEEFALLMGS